MEKPSCLWQCLSGTRLWVPLLRGTEVGTVLLCDRLTYQLDFVIIREGFEHHHQRHIRNLLRSGYFFVTGEIICLWHKYLLGCNFQIFIWASVSLPSLGFSVAFLLAPLSHKMWWTCHHQCFIKSFSKIEILFLFLFKWSDDLTNIQH